MRRTAAGGPYHLKHALSFKCPSIRQGAALRMSRCSQFRGHASHAQAVRAARYCPLACGRIFCFSRRLMTSQGVFCSRVLSTAPVIRAMWGRQVCNRRTQAPLREVFIFLKTIFYHLGFIKVRRYFDTGVLDFRVHQNGRRGIACAPQLTLAAEPPSRSFLEKSLGWQAIPCPLRFITLDKPVSGLLRKGWVSKCTFTPPATVRATVWP